eukprot:1705353-Pyramimonas_sp.AAC.2
MTIWRSRTSEHSDRARRSEVEAGRERRETIATFQRNRRQLILVSVTQPPVQVRMAAIRQEGGASASIELMASQSKDAEVSRVIENHLTRRRRRQAIRERRGER